MGEWLCTLGLDEYAPTFVREHVDGASLGMLARADLHSLGVHTVGHRLQLLRAIGELGLTVAGASGAAAAHNGNAQHGQTPPAPAVGGVPATTHAVRELRFSEPLPVEHHVLGEE